MGIGPVKGLERKEADSSGFFDLELSGECDVTQLINRLEVPENKVGLVSVNKKTVNKNEPLHTGDRVIFFPFVAGG